MAGYPRRPRERKRRDTPDIEDGLVRARQRKRYEESAVVLDVMPEGKGISRSNREPIVQVVGQTWFTLLELVPKANISLMPLDVIQIGSENRDQIETIKGRIAYSDLSNLAIDTLPIAIANIVSMKERRFVEFFNKAQPITNRKHSLELLPGVGKALMWEIIEARKSLPFTSLEDVQERTKIQDPVKLIVNRIIEELRDEPKHRLFTRK